MGLFDCLNSNGINLLLTANRWSIKKKHKERRASRCFRKKMLQQRIALLWQWEIYPDFSGLYCSGKIDLLSYEGEFVCHNIRVSLGFIYTDIRLQKSVCKGSPAHFRVSFPQRFHRSPTLKTHSQLMMHLRHSQAAGSVMTREGTEVLCSAHPFQRHHSSLSPAKKAGQGLPGSAGPPHAGGTCTAGLAQINLYTQSQDNTVGCSESNLGQAATQAQSLLWQVSHT